eukprot:Hpha_TRINITY_DN9655_c0_g1::TRINITY_DN9655_c0_g1_i1::g.184565::m.184565
MPVEVGFAEVCHKPAVGRRAVRCREHPAALRAHRTNAAGGERENVALQTVPATYPEQQLRRCPGEEGSALGATCVNARSGSLDSAAGTACFIIVFSVKTDYFF